MIDLAYDYEVRSNCGAHGEVEEAAAPGLWTEAAGRAACAVLSGTLLPVDEGSIASVGRQIDRAPEGGC